MRGSSSASPLQCVLPCPHAWQPAAVSSSPHSKLRALLCLDSCCSETAPPDLHSQMETRLGVAAGTKPMARGVPM